MTKQLRSAEEILWEIKTAIELMKLTYDKSEKTQAQEDFRNGFMACSELIMDFMNAKNEDQALPTDSGGTENE